MTYLLAKAIEDAGTVDPDKLIPALEKAQIETQAGKVTMRKVNHQMETGIYWGPLVPADPPYHRSMDKAKVFWLPDIEVSLTDKEILELRTKGE
jgi:ABC-type branched-subunit amino acid transport system substrate-binding protein